jgi:hypothetical protein
LYGKPRRPQSPGLWFSEYKCSTYLLGIFDKKGGGIPKERVFTSAPRISRELGPWEIPHFA